MHVCTRPLGSAYRQQLIALYRRGFGEPPWNEDWSEEAAASVVDNPQLHWWIAVEGDLLVGFLAGIVSSYGAVSEVFGLPDSGDTSASCAYLAELVVHPDYRRRGIARSLTNVFLGHARCAADPMFFVRTKPGTGNYAWYERMLHVHHQYSDGRVLFFSEDIPSSL